MSIYSYIYTLRKIAMEPFESGFRACFFSLLREAAKKVLLLMAGPLRKKDFLKFFKKFCCQLKIKVILL